ncbi:MAG: hypothetical protein WD042_08655 [Phycisphaeraceae bacterium]
MKSKSMFTMGALLAAAMTAGTAQGVVQFDSTGTGTFVAGQNTTLLDWFPGNTLADQGNEAVANFVGGAGSTEFHTYYQAVLGSYTVSGVGTQLMPAGTELTIVVGFREQVVGVSGSPGGTGAAAEFAWLPEGADYFEIYFDSAAATLNGATGTGPANTLSGAGYNQGQLILRADLQSVNNTTFTVLDDNAGPLDQSDTFTAGNQYPGIETVGGNGETQLTARITEWDTDFFSFSPDDAFTIQLALLQNVGVNLPYGSIDPSAAFTDSENAGAIGTAGSATLLTADIGTLNGGPVGGAGSEDIQFQTDTNMSFSQATTIIPEPITAGLSLMALGGLGVSVLRRRR